VLFITGRVPFQIGTFVSVRISSCPSPGPIILKRPGPMSLAIDILEFQTCGGATLAFHVWATAANVRTGRTLIVGLLRCALLRTNCANLQAQWLEGGSPPTRIPGK
jgi:hypothetical protein